MFTHKTSHHAIAKTISKSLSFFNSAESRQGNICINTCELQCRHVIFFFYPNAPPPPHATPNLHKFVIPIFLKKHVRHRVYRVPAFLPVVRIGSSLPPHPQASVAPPTFGSKGGETFATGEGGGGPIQTKRQAFWYSMYTLIPI